MFSSKTPCSLVVLQWEQCATQLFAPVCAWHPDKTPYLVRRGYAAYITFASSQCLHECPAPVATWRRVGITYRRMHVQAKGSVRASCLSSVVGGLKIQMVATTLAKKHCYSKSKREGRWKPNHLLLIMKLH